MNYDETVFKEKANRRARKIWLVFAILLSANYGSDTSNGLHSATYYLTFLALCWIPFIAGEILLRVKGWATERYKSRDRIWYLLYLCDHNNRITDRIYIHSSGNKSSCLI